MSRTEKVHTHKSPGVERLAASLHAKVKAIRSASKSEIRKMSDPEDMDFAFENKRRSHRFRPGSAGYLDPTTTEADCLKKMLSAKQTILNNAHPWYEYLFIDNTMRKDIKSRAKQKDPTFKGNAFQAMLLLTNEELAECVHRYYASKGLKGTKQ